MCFLCVLCVCFFLDGLPVIDTDSDLDEAEDGAERDSGQQISDCESDPYNEKPQDITHKPTNVSQLFNQQQSPNSDETETGECK